MTLTKAIGATIACALSLVLLHNAHRDRRRGAPLWSYGWGYGASLLWAVSAYIVATGVDA